MSLLETNIFDECCGSDLDLLDNTYYKLPFCDEDVHELRNPSFGEGLWEQTIDDEINNCFSHSTTPGLSPSSTSSTTSGSQNVPDHLLLKERPDTPLMAIKFEDFSNNYNFGDLSSQIFADNCDETMAEVNVDDEITLDVDQVHRDRKKGSSTSGSERIVDCSLAPSAAFPAPRIENIFQIIKNKDGNTTAKAAALPGDVKNEGMKLSFSKNQPTVPSLSTPGSSQSNNGDALLYLSDQAGAVKPAPTKPSPSAADPQPAPVHRFKVIPHGKLATNNTFTHKTHIQIPTSTLQTILKNGRLVTRLQQQDGKIRIKAESCPGVKQYVKINNAQVDLPPTPPSSGSSDGEGSSSPSRSPSSFTSTRIRVQPSGTSLAAQLLSSSQRFAQTHGPLVLTEEEKRTLVAEGYPVPTKLPLSKSEEKSLKKVRRKIKNKLSAQESRRKKKEYVETLEKRMDDFNKENMDLKRKLDSLESSNRSLLSQLRSLQTLVAGKMPKPSRSVTTQTSSCLMMLVLCFAIFLGGWYPRLSPWGSSLVSSPALYQQQADDVAATGGKVMFSLKADEHCGGERECGVWKQEDGKPPEQGSDTYDEPAGGGSTMNDTGDETSKMIANTMEPRSPADVLASRKMAVKSNKMETALDGESPHDVTKKIVMTSQLVAE